MKIEDYPKGLLQETAKAFADTILPWEEGKNIRNLAWQGEYADGEMFLKQSEIVGKYNLFSPDVAREIVDFFPEGTQFRLAREGSVAVYIKLDGACQMYIKLRGNPLNDGCFLSDEIHLEKEELRLWWD